MFLKDLRGYESLGTFVVVLGLMILAWSARRDVDKRVRLYLLWLALVSVVVLLIPLQLGDVSIWRTVFAPLPGFSAIRDPKRIIYTYELAVALLAGWILTRLPRRSVVRASALVLLLIGLLVQSHVASFVILRFTGLGGMAKNTVTNTSGICTQAVRRLLSTIAQTTIGTKVTNKSRDPGTPCIKSDTRMTIAHANSIES